MDSLPVWLSTFIIGLGTVFVALFLLIYIIKIMGAVCSKFLKKKPEVAAPQKKPTPAPAAAQAPETVENRGELVAACASAIATVMGKDVEAIRIVSIKKVD